MSLQSTGREHGGGDLPRPRWLDVPEYVRIRPDIPPPKDDALARRQTRRRAELSERRARRREGVGRLGWAIVAIAAVAALTLGIRRFGSRHWAADPAAFPAVATRALAVGDTAGRGLPVGQRGAEPVWLDPGAAGGPANAASGHAGAVSTDADPVGGAEDTPRDTVTPPLPPTPPVEAELPIVPPIDGAMKERLRAVHAMGLERGRQPGVFAKIGDSITVSTFFLTELGCGHAVLGENAALGPTIDFFAVTALEGAGTPARCTAVNAFTRASVAAGSGWIAVQVLTPMAEPPPGCEAPNDTPLRCEVVKTRPSIALVMFGTNDLHQRIGLRSFEASMTTIVRELVDVGVIPVLSTIPHRPASPSADARVGDYNAVVRSVAASQQVPLWNFWRAVAGEDMVRRGMEPDGVHPNAHAHGANLSGGGLRYGYNQRNLTALQVLDKIRRIVIEDGPAD